MARARTQSRRISSADQASKAPGGRTVLVVAAHPDDEVLGCGGTIAAHAAAGDRVSVLILGEGVTSRKGLKPREAAKAVKALQESAVKAAYVLGAQEAALAGLPDNRFDSVDLLDIVHLVEQFKNRVKPDIVYTHHHGDLNIDHRLTHQAVLTACRPLPGETVREIYAFEILSATEWQAPHPGLSFHPNHFVDISDMLPRKLAAMEVYKPEVRSWPHPRSLEGIVTQAHGRGIQIGREAAEAFEVIRSIR